MGITYDPSLRLRDTALFLLSERATIELFPRDFYEVFSSIYGLSSVVGWTLIFLALLDLKMSFPLSFAVQGEIPLCGDLVHGYSTRSAKGFAINVCAAYSENHLRWPNRC
jgi:hypothetical protein